MSSNECWKELNPFKLLNESNKSLFHNHGTDDPDDAQGMLSPGNDFDLSSPGLYLAMNSEKSSDLQAGKTFNTGEGVAIAANRSPYDTLKHNREVNTGHVEQPGDQTSFRPIVFGLESPLAKHLPPNRENNILDPRLSPPDHTNSPTHSRGDDPISSPLCALLSAQDELIANLRNELSLKQEIINQYAVDLSLHGELVRLLSIRAQSAEQEAATWRLYCQRQGGHMRRM